MTEPTQLPDGWLPALLAIAAGWVAWVTERMIRHRHPLYVSHKDLAEIRAQRDREWRSSLEDLRLEVKGDFETLRDEMREELRDLPRAVADLVNRGRL